MTAYRDRVDGDGWTMYLGDCREILPTLTGIDAVVTDPPYGQNYIGSPSRSRNGVYVGNNLKTYVTVVGDDSEFDPTPWLRWPCAFTGARWFYWNLPRGGSLHSWDKRGDYKPMTFADADIVWVSRDIGTRTFRCLWRGLCRHTEADQTFEHPTQKPVAVMKWLIDMLELGSEQTVLDPFAGSGTTGVACIETGRRFVGIEIDENYFKVACNRLRNATPCLFGKDQ